MYITELSIKRPVVAAVFSMILVVFGLFVFSKLPVRELPSGLQPPVVQVQVDYQGASAEVISSEITEIIEDVIGGAEGIKNIDSTSENGRSTIKIEFETSIDLDAAANDIRDRVSRVSDNLPTDSKPPEILKQSAGFTTSMWLSVSSSTWTDLEIGDYTRRYLVDSFSNVKGVGRILVGGLRELSVRVYIDPIKLAANDLTIQEVEQSLRKENISLPAGSLEATNIDLTNFSQGDWNKLHQSMTNVIDSPIGTSRRLKDLKSFQVAGKSGTAELVSLDSKEDYLLIRENEAQRDHAIMIAFGPMPEPKYAVSVVIENGESGGAVAGPVAISVLKELIK